jgi:hypothetical protein
LVDMRPHPFAAYRLPPGLGLEWTSEIRRGLRGARSGPAAARALNAIQGEYASFGHSYRHHESHGDPIRRAAAQDGRACARAAYSWTWRPSQHVPRCCLLSTPVQGQSLTSKTWAPFSRRNNMSAIIRKTLHQRFRRLS